MQQSFHLLGAKRPSDPLTRGSAPGSRRGHSPQILSIFPQCLLRPAKLRRLDKTLDKHPLFSDFVFAVGRPTFA